MGLFSFQGIGFRISSRVLFGFRVPPRLVVPAHPSRSHSTGIFDVYVFLCCFAITVYHCSMVTYKVVFGDIVHEVSPSIFPKHVEILFPDSVSDPIKSRVCLSRYFMFCCSVDNSVFLCIVCCHRCWWLLVPHIC